VSRPEPCPVPGRRPGQRAPRGHRARHSPRRSGREREASATCCLRGGCLTGPNHSGVELHGFLSYLIKCTITGQPYRIFGYKGKQVRDNIHAVDVARFIERFVEAPRPGEVYNIGGGRDNSCSILEAFALAEDVRDAYLEERAQHVHVTDMGLCIHDFAVSPCPYHLNCLKGEGCPDYLHDTQDPVQRTQLVQLTVRTKEVLEEEKRQAAEQGEEISESWVADSETVLRNAEAILAAKPGPGKTVVQPFLTGERRRSRIED
jgi:hypothetical protein